MAQVDSSVLEVVEDLKNKIETLKNAGNDANEQTLQRVNEIKQKAIFVLSQASNKIVESANGLSNADEIERGIDIIKVKSKELYENALNKINSLVQVEKISEEIEKTNEEIKEEVKEEIKEEVKEEVKVETKPLNENRGLNDISYEAISVLREWLKEK